jgi:ADP-ribose pyrophosphatase YjhB (NUDIX family)
MGHKRFVCISCGYTHYKNPRVVVCCVVHWRDCILMIRRAEEPARGLWSLPCGYLECGETLEEGAARETCEESGVVVEPARLELSFVINMVSLQQVAVGFRTELGSMPTTKPGPECSDARFLKEGEIPPEQFAWYSSMGRVSQRSFEETRLDRHTIVLASLSDKHGVNPDPRVYNIATIMPRAKMGL